MSKSFNLFFFITKIWFMAFLFSYILLHLPYVLTIYVFFLTILVAAAWLPRLARKIFKTDIVYAFLIYLKNKRILHFFYNVEYSFFSDDNKHFYLITALANISHFSYYVLHQRVVFLTVIGSRISEEMYLLYSFILSILFIGVLFKAFINLVNFCVLQSYYTYGNLLKNDPTDVEPISTSKPTAFYSVFSRHYNTFQNSPFTPKISNWGKLGIVCAVCMVGFGAGSLYYTRQSAIATIRAADAADRAADVAEVQAGLRTQESYNKKWGKAP